jgi:mannose-1-phosphate guanylyltransferase
MKRTALIMAGGSGERFWPLSRRTTPKQLLKLGDSEMTMLEEAIDRISLLISVEDIYIITGSHLLEPIRRIVPNLPPQNVIAEPAKRNTAPCLALGAAFVRAKYPELDPSQISIAVLTADHIIKPKEKFASTVETALDFVENNKFLATIGVAPNRIETGYGYIELENSIDSAESALVQPVISFREKPSFEKAKEYIETKRFLWNSGMFFWRLDTFTEEMIKVLPEVGNAIEAIAQKYINNTDTAFNSHFADIEAIFAGLPNISIDYGLMEKAARVAVVKAQFLWDDCGSWDSLERTMILDETGNIISGDCIEFENKNTIVFNTSDKLVVTAFGLDDIAIVTTNDAVMVCPKSRVQEVKEIVNRLKSAGREELY